MKILIILFLLPVQLLAQDITGVWAGVIQTSGNSLPYELVISETKEDLTGYAMTVFTINGIENIGIKTIKLKRKNGTLSIEDDELIYNNYTTPPKRSKLTGTLYLTAGGSKMALSGNFMTRSLDFRDRTSYSGSIQLQRQNNEAQTRLMAKLEELNLLRSLSIAQPKVEKKKEVAIVAADVQKTPPALQKKDEQAVAATPLIIEEFSPPVVVAKKKESSPPAIPATKAPPLPGREEKGKRPEAVAKTATEKKVQPLTEPKQKNMAPEIPSVKTMEAIGPSDVELAARKTEVIRSVSFISDSLVLSLYDNGTIDGDTVSVVLNGRVIMPKKGLTTHAIRETIYITPESGDSLQLIMYAENLGRIPPNTGLLIVQDGTDRHEIRFSGDMQKSSAIILKRRR